MGGGPGGQGFSGFQGFHSNIDPEELFRNIFGDFAKGFGDQSSAGYDFEFAAPQELQLSLTFKEAAKGCTKEVKVNVIDTCPKCQGSKYEPLDGQSLERQPTHAGCRLRQSPHSCH